MAVRKPEEGKTQRQKFIEASRKLGITESDDKAFREAVRKVAMAKKTPRKPKN